MRINGCVVMPRTCHAEKWTWLEYRFEVLQQSTWLESRVLNTCFAVSMFSFSMDPYDPRLSTLAETDRRANYLNKHIERPCLEMLIKLITDTVIVPKLPITVVWSRACLF